MPQIICGFCKNQFRIPNSRKNTAKFCSASCRSKVICRKSIQKGWTMKGRKHTEFTKKKLSNNMIGKIGKFARNWKGGISRAYKTGYYSSHYKKWRINVFERDNYTCQNCGISGSKKYLTAHHIKSFSHHPELRFSLSNGLTLCELCHSKTDNYKGKGNKFKRTKKLT